MNVADLAHDVLIVLPEYLRITAMIAVPVGTAGGLLFLCDKADDWFRDRHRRKAQADVEQRMQELAERERQRRLEALNAFGDSFDRVWPENVTRLPQREPAPVIPIPTDLMDHDGLGAA